MQTNTRIGLHRIPPYHNITHIICTKPTHCIRENVLAWIKHSSHTRGRYLKFCFELKYRFNLNTFRQLWPRSRLFEQNYIKISESTVNWIVFKTTWYRTISFLIWKNFCNWVAMLKQKPVICGLVTKCFIESLLLYTAWDLVDGGVVLAKNIYKAPLEL